MVQMGCWGREPGLWHPSGCRAGLEILCPHCGDRPCTGFTFGGSSAPYPIRIWGGSAQAESEELDRVRMAGRLAQVASVNWLRESGAGADG